MMNLLNNSEEIYVNVKEITDAVDTLWSPHETKIQSPYNVSASYSFTTDFGFDLHSSQEVNNYVPPLNLKLADLTMADGRCLIENTANNTFNLSGNFLLRTRLRCEGSIVKYYDIYLVYENARAFGHSNVGASVNTHADLPSGYILSSADSIRTVLPNEIGLVDLELKIYMETVANAGSGGDLILEIEIQEVL